MLVLQGCASDSSLRCAPFGMTSEIDFGAHTPVSSRRGTSPRATLTVLPFGLRLPKDERLKMTGRRHPFALSASKGERLRFTKHRHPFALSASKGERLRFTKRRHPLALTVSKDKRL